MLRKHCILLLLVSQMDPVLLFESKIYEISSRKSTKAIENAQRVAINTHFESSNSPIHYRF